jgi:hypothetical protein
VAPQQWRTQRLGVDLQKLDQLVRKIDFRGFLTFGKQIALTENVD